MASKGVEVEAAVSVPGNVELTAAYSYNDAKVTESLFAPEAGQRLSDVPRHMASLWGVKTLRPTAAAALRVGAGVRYIADTASTWATSTRDTPTYTIPEPLASIAWEWWTSAAQATNSLDRPIYA